MTGRLAVGVDIGGTKTRILAGDAEGRIVDDITVPSSSWRGALGDAEADAAGIARLLRGRLGAAAEGAAIAIGAHGCENTGQCDALEAALRSRLDGPIRVVNDAELIAPAMRAHGVRDRVDGRADRCVDGRAIGVVVGTGSIATARDGGGALVTAGGWGWILGDEGSAPALVRDAVRAVLGELDRGGEPDALGRGLLTAFGAGDQDALALALTQATHPDEWGRHAPLVFAAADAGSPLAERVIAQAGADLATLVARLRRRGVAADVVVAGGSVIERQPRLQAAFRGALARSCPDIELRILDRPPVYGALALARDLDHTPQERQTP